MKRELKFRAWDGSKIRYDVTGLEHGQSNEMAGVFLDGDYYSLKGHSEHVNQAQLMQFTGIKDKNGTDIYEGDVVKFFYDTWLDKIDVIKFHKHSFGYGSEHIFSSFHCLEADVGYYDLSNTMTVIGNIYESPELLEQK